MTCTLCGACDIALLQRQLWAATQGAILSSTIRPLHLLQPYHPMLHCCERNLLANKLVADAGTLTPLASPQQFNCERSR